ncbi:hypothetical protein R3P38DRAFT_2758995 [Favolaschia claudopus]|uniref:Uncharacterized protein n=1 Tax=Favolaschia claudopus TaxID=2862362 RepID=A0AAW0E855_9AGAR
MASVDKDYSIFLTPPIEGMNDEVGLLVSNNMLQSFNAVELANLDEDGNPDPQILVALQAIKQLSLSDYVYDMSTLKKFLGPNRLYSKYAGKDISCALAKYSYNEADIDAIGYSELWDKELTTLNQWCSVFRKRFQIVGRFIGR